MTKLKKQTGKNKKALVIGGISVIVLAIFLSWLFGWGVKKERQELVNLKPTPTIKPLELSKEEKPEIELKINANRSGATLIVSNISEKFSQLEYELIYLAESDGQEIERGLAGGPIEIPSNRKVTITDEEILFGTRSCTTGVCRYHIDKNVSGGTLIVRLITPENQVWSLEKDFIIEKATSGYKAVWAERH